MMNIRDERYPLAFIVAVLIHLVLFGLLIFKWYPPKSYSALSKQAIIQAIAIDTQQLQQPIAKPTTEQLRKQQPVKSIAQQQAEQKQQLAVQQAQQRKIVKAKAEQAQQQKLAKAKAEQAQQQKLAKAKAEQALQQKLAKAKAEQALQQKLAKAKAEQAAKKQLLAAKKAQAINDLTQQLAAEDELLAINVAQQARIQQEVDKYKAMILTAISQQWIVPDTAQQGLSCKVRVRLAPGGSVLNVQLLTSSGDAALDRSAIAAVNKSSPLPVPSDPMVFEPFREIDLLVQPGYE